MRILIMAGSVITALSTLICAWFSSGRSHVAWNPIVTGSFVPSVYRNWTAAEGNVGNIFAPVRASC